MHARRFVAFLLAVAGVAGTARCLAQDITDRYGAYLFLNFNRHRPNFIGLPNYPSCCPLYEEGSATRYSGGLLYESPWTRKLLYEFRLGIDNKDGLLKDVENTTVSVNGIATPGKFEHTIDASIMAAEFMPLLVYRPSQKFSMLAGGSIEYVLRKQFHQKETILEPESGVYENGERTRNEYEATIPNARSLLFGLVMGARYEFPFNSRKSSWGAFEAFYTIGLSRIVTGLDWYINSFRLGVAVLLMPGRDPETAPSSRNLGPEDGESSTPPETNSERHKDDEQPAGNKIKSVHTSALERVMQSHRQNRYGIRQELAITTQMRPLLNYVFFDHQSDAIPERYVRISRAESGSFTINALHRARTLDMYHRILDIVGRRLTDHPDASVTLVGCNSNTAEEKNNLALSRRRAEHVRDYLVRTWGIDVERMAIVVRNLPEIPSYPTDSDGISENRRVEIQSPVWEILEPIETIDTLQRATPDYLRIALKSDQPDVRSWSLRAYKNNSPVFTRSGPGLPPDYVDLRSAEITDNGMIAAGMLRLNLTTVDGRNIEKSEDVGELVFESSFGEQDEYEVRPDRIVRKFNLILFEFDSPKLNEYHRRVVSIIQNRVPPASEIDVTGYTDRMGTDDRNLQLSEGRAKSVSDALGYSQALYRGFGETDIFNNDLPEGRCYNRTVEILASTPIVR